MSLVNEPPSVLADAVLLLRASSVNPETHVNGDPWVNEGTAGSDYNAIGGTGALEPPNPGIPLLVDDDGPGFSFGHTSPPADYYYVPQGPAIEFGAGSFTAFARFKWTEATSGGLDNVMSKILGTLGTDMHGWQIVDLGALGTTIAAISNGGSSPGTDPALAMAGDTLELGEHLLVIRVNRDTEELALFVDGAKSTTSAAGTPTVAVEHQLIFGRGKEQLGRAYGAWGRALTDTEITVDLPEAIG